MITSFGDKGTSDLFQGISSRDTRKVPIDCMFYKFDVLNAAQVLDDLRSLPSNRLESLEGNRKGFNSIRINSQWGIIFRWVESGATDVQVVGYH